MLYQKMANDDLIAQLVNQRFHYAYLILQTPEPQIFHSNSESCTKILINLKTNCKSNVKKA